MTPKMAIALAAIGLRSDTVTRPTPPMRAAIAAEAPDAAAVVDQAQERGVLVFAFGPRTLRAVTHLDLSSAQCDRAAQILVAITEGRSC